MLIAQRKALHRVAGEAIEALFPERLDELAATLAYHFDRADVLDKAIAFLLQAGNRAVKLSAFEEAVEHFSRGLELLNGLPDSPERKGQELELQLPLAVALMNLKGFGDPEVGAAFAYARGLCDQIGDTPQIFVALFGLGTFYCASAEYKAAVEMAERILRIAPKAPDPSILLLIGHTGQAANLSFLGKSKQALVHVGQFLDIYEPQRHDSLVFLLGQNLKSNSMSWATFDLWLRGYPDQAREMSRETLALARELAYPNALVFALNWASILAHFCRDVQSLQELSEECLALSTLYGAQMWIGAATVFRGWSLVEQGRTTDGLAQVRQGHAIFRATGSAAFQPYFLAMMAEAHSEAGQLEEGLAALEEGLACVKKTGERFYEAEIHRLKGELLLAQSEGVAETEAEALFRKAIEVARRQSARSLELRAATSLGRLQQKQGRREEGRDLVAEIYGCFTEGFDTADLQDAKALLEELDESQYKPKTPTAS
jgi:predicted ATPase